MFATFSNVHHDAPELTLRKAALTQNVHTESVGTKPPRVRVTLGQVGRVGEVWSTSYIGFGYNSLK